MALVVEDGTGLATAESYLSVAGLRSRALALGLWYLCETTPTQAWLESQTDDAVAAALRRATMYIDAQYGASWVGARATREQALDWPRRTTAGFSEVPRDAVYFVGTGPRRSVAWPYDGYVVGGTPELSTGSLPPRLLDAVAQIAVRELARPGALMPDTVQGAVRSESVAGAISVTYEPGRVSVDTIPMVESLLQSLLSGNGAVSALRRA